jgi:hypothetical protein
MSARPDVIEKVSWGAWLIPTMGETTLETIDELLKGSIEETDDADVSYKLRSARQLIDVVRMRHEEIDETIEEVQLDEEILENLRELGYVE